MLTKLAKWCRKLAQNASKTDMERYLERSKDLHDLECRMRKWERQSDSMWPDARYY